MRKLIAALSVVVALLGAVVLAQEIPLTSPVARSSEAKYKIRSFNATLLGTNSASIDLSVQDSSNVEIRTFSAVIPGCGTTTVAGLATAMITVRATETGTDGRKLSFRIVGYLSDQGCLPGTNAPIP